MKLHKHKKTGSILEPKKILKNVGLFYILDKNNKKIENGRTCEYKTSYRKAVCSLDNLKTL